MKFSQYFIRFLIRTIFHWFVWILPNSFVQSRDIGASMCPLSAATKQEILSYVPVVERMRKTIQSGLFKRKTYDDIEDFIDTVGPRLSGSKGLERAIIYLSEKLNQPDTGLKYHKKEPVQIPKQKVGTSFAELILPRKKDLLIIPQRTCQNTPGRGILADVLVVSSYKEFLEKRPQVLGKMLLLNFKFVNRKQYVDVIKVAGKIGALAVLLRSEVSFPLYSPSEFIYLTDPPSSPPIPIPVASMTVEDTELLYRMSNRGKQVVVFLSIQGCHQTVTTSYNLISDYEGAKLSNEYVVISGHMDNVKVGLGVQDDAIGLFLSLNTVRLLRLLQLTPKRTIRVIFWTGEEFGLYGAKQHVKNHMNDLTKYKAALEGDLGCQGIPGFITSLHLEFGCILKEILVSALGYKINETSIDVGGEIHRTDVGEFVKWVPSALMATKNSGKYYWYHHTSGDTIVQLNPKEADNCLLIYATVAYILSDLETLPKITSNVQNF